MSLKAVINFVSHKKSVEDGIGKFVDRAVSRSLLVMVSNIKKNTPYDHGHLRRSINNRKTGFGKGEVFSGATEGGVEINYAIYQEYGTRYQPPRAMFRKGVGMSKKRIQEIFAEEAKKVHDKASGV